jgi:hypothetical protein
MTRALVSQCCLNKHGYFHRIRIALETTQTQTLTFSVFMNLVLNIGWKLWMGGRPPQPTLGQILNIQGPPKKMYTQFNERKLYVV